MNKEVKEILDKLDRARLIYDLILTPEECHILYDYITLLEKTVKIKDKAFMGTVKELTETATEKEKLEKENEKYKKLGFEHLCKKNAELEERIDKALHKIHNLKQQVQSFRDKIPCWLDELENDLGGDK